MDLFAQLDLQKHFVASNFILDSVIRDMTVRFESVRFCVKIILFYGRVKK